MVWAGVEEESGRLKQLNALLETACEALGFKAEKRAFRPHLTLGRVKGGRNVDRLRAAADDYADADFGECAVDKLIVFSSELGPGGPTYAALSHAPLGG
jgi:2'-5' RNA ligase